MWSTEYYCIWCVTKTNQQPPPPQQQLPLQLQLMPKEKTKNTPTTKNNTKRPSSSASPQEEKRRRGPNYTEAEIEAAIRLVVRDHTFRIGEEMAKKGFPERDANDYKKKYHLPFLLGEKQLPMILMMWKLEMILYWWSTIKQSHLPLWIGEVPKPRKTKSKKRCSQKMLICLLLWMILLRKNQKMDIEPCTHNIFERVIKWSLLTSNQT